VSELSYDIFNGAKSLAEINIDPAHKVYRSVEGVVYSADMDSLCFYPAGKPERAYTVIAGTRIVGKGAFSQNTHLESVTFPEGVATIYDFAFMSCTALKNVSFPESVTSIGRSAFAQCVSLEKIVLPPHITEIPSVLLSLCSAIRSVTIPAEVTNIGLTPFLQNNNLKEITCLATTPPTLNAMAFLAMAQADITLYVPEEAVETYKATATWKNFNVQPVAKIEHLKIGDLYYNLDLQDKTAQVTWQFYNSFDNYISLTAVNIPATVSYQGQELSVTEIGIKAFAYDTLSITSVSIPEGIICINDSAFYGCEKLADVNFPNSVEHIGIQAFELCKTIKALTFGSGLKTIGDYAFLGCTKFTTLTIPDNVERIGEAAFSTCNGLKTVTIGSGTTSIGNDAFYSCNSIEEIMVSPENPAYCSADDVLFNKDKTTLIKYPTAKTGDYVVPSSVTKIERGGFLDCVGLTAVTLPEGLISIGSVGFSHCIGLTEVVIPNSVTSIGDIAFIVCSGLTKVTIGSGVTTIGAMAFSSCSALATIYNYAATPQAVNGMTFLSVPTACTLYVPEESVELYKAAPIWKNFNVQAITGTGINLTPSVSKGEGAWYTLDGRKLDGKPTKKGIYINNSMMVVVK
jgi:hypothetical protein